MYGVLLVAAGMSGASGDEPTCISQRTVYALGHPPEFNFEPSPASQLCQDWSIYKIFYFANGGIDIAILDVALQFLLAEVPVLAGRLHLPVTSPFNEVAVICNNEGALLTEYEHATATIESVGPSSWSSAAGGHPQHGFPSPWYAPCLTQSGLRSGQDPILAVRLSHCADGGQIVAVAAAHVVSDGGRLVHVAARLSQYYRWAASWWADWARESRNPKSAGSAAEEDDASGQADPAALAEEALLRQLESRPPPPGRPLSTACEFMTYEGALRAFAARGLHPTSSWAPVELDPTLSWRQIFALPLRAWQLLRGRWEVHTLELSDGCCRFLARLASEEEASQGAAPEPLKAGPVVQRTVHVLAHGAEDGAAPLDAEQEAARVASACTNPAKSEIRLPSVAVCPPGARATCGSGGSVRSTPSPDASPLSRESGSHFAAGQVSRMDAMQAFVRLLAAWAEGRPPVTPAPAHAIINVDMRDLVLGPDRRGDGGAEFLGNAVTILRLLGPAPGPQAAELERLMKGRGGEAEAVAALGLHARAIRAALSALRAGPEGVLQALAEHRQLSSMAKARLAAVFLAKGAEDKAYVTSCVNTFDEEDVDFGGGRAACSRIIVTPQFDRYALVQRAGGGGRGVVVAMSLPAGCGPQLLTHPLWAWLPQGWKIHLAGGGGKAG